MPEKDYGPDVETACMVAYAILHPDKVVATSHLEIGETYVLRFVTRYRMLDPHDFAIHRISFMAGYDSLPEPEGY